MKMLEKWELFYSNLRETDAMAGDYEMRL